MNFNLMSVTSCESVGSEVCSVYDRTCEGETARSVAGTLMLFFFFFALKQRLSRGTKCVCVYVCLCACVYFLMLQKFTELLRTGCQFPSQHGVTHKSGPLVFC